MTVRHPYMPHTLAAEPLLAVGLNNDSRRGRIPVEWREVPGGMWYPSRAQTGSGTNTRTRGDEGKALLKGMGSR